ncbi:MAG: hypothetical protein R3B68_11965 [Phycisphaerales bacterium]
MPTPHSPSPPNPTSPAPPEPIHRATLPHALTFFLTVAQRRAVLKSLRRLHRSREAALLRALDIPTPDPTTGVRRADTRPGRRT